MQPRQKMETESDIEQELIYADLLTDMISDVNKIHKLNPGQYSIDWVAYNDREQVLWWAEFKRRYKPYSFFENGVIGISAYKIVKLRQFHQMGKPALMIFGLDDCMLAATCTQQLAGLKHGGNPNPKDEWEQEPMAYYKTASLKKLNI